MFQKKKKNLLPVILIFTLSIVLAIIGVVALPVPAKYKQLVFWGVLVTPSVVTALVNKIKRRRM